MCRIGGPGRGGGTRGDRRLSFQERVRLAAARNAGLHVSQQFYSVNVQGTVSGQMVVLDLAFYPNDYNVMGVVTTGTDEKAFVEKIVSTDRYFNNSNVPLFVRIIYAYVRRDIPNDTYTTFNSLLQDGAPMQVNLAHGNPLTSNAAQRYLKWLRTDEYTLEGGKVMTVRLENYLKRSISGDYEGDISLLSIRGSLVAFVCFDSVPISDSLNSGLIGTGPISLQYTGCDEVHWRDIENGTPTSVVAQAFPSLSGFGNVVEPQSSVAVPVLD